MENASNNINSTNQQPSAGTVNACVAVTDVEVNCPKEQPKSVYMPTVVTQQPNPTFGPLPQPANCHVCGSKDLTAISQATGKASILASVACCVVCPPLFFLPLIASGLKDVDHSCPKCGTKVGTHALLKF